MQKKSRTLIKVDSKTSWRKTSPRYRCRSGKLLKFLCGKESPDNDQIHVSIKNTGSVTLERLEMRPSLGGPYSLSLAKNKEKTYIFNMPDPEPDRLGIDTYAQGEGCIEYYMKAELKLIREREAKARELSERKQEIFENCVLAKMPSDPDRSVRGIILRKCREISRNPSILDRLRY